MVDILLTDGRPLPLECEHCLEVIRPRAKVPVLDIFCTNTGKLAMLTTTTTGIEGRTDIRVVGTTEVVMCPRGG